MGIGINLKRILKEKSIKVAELSRLSGVPASSLYGILHRDSKGVNGDTLQKIANALNVSIADLVADDFFEDEYQDTGYYLDPATAELAQEMYENEDLRVLFDAARDAKPNDLKIAYDMLIALKKKEQHEE